MKPLYSRNASIPHKSLRSDCHTTRISLCSTLIYDPPICRAMTMYRVVRDVIYSLRVSHRDSSQFGDTLNFHRERRNKKTDERETRDIAHRGAIVRVVSFGESFIAKIP